MVEGRIAVVYLARFAEGVEPVQKFIDSYKKHPAGAPHDLIIVFKGFTAADISTSPQHKICAEVAHREIHIADIGLDLTAYRRAAEDLDHEYICFLNTFSQILSDDWLQKLHGHASRDDVGMVGATGSYESLGLSMKGMCKAVYMCCMKIPYDPLYADLWPKQIEEQAPGWLQNARGRWWRRKVYEAIGWRQKHKRAYHAKFEWAWTEPGKEYAGFPGFPNPHLRSNAFMLKRTAFLSRTPASILTKTQAFRVESGPDSLTAQMHRAHLRTLVVGRNGLAYEPSQWESSDTFRKDAQQNLLVADNQTIAFDNSNDTQRLVMRSWTWGPLFPGLILDCATMEKIMQNHVHRPSEEQVSAV